MAAGMLVAAEEVFAEAGLAKAHVEAIARRAGVSVGTLYNYYKDRDGLLAAVLTSRVEELSVELDEVKLRTEGATARAALLELSRTYLRFVVRRRTFIRILTEGELMQLKDAYPTSAAIPSQCWHSFRGAFGAVLSRGIEAGELSSRDPDLDLWLFLGLLRGVVLRDLRGGTPCKESDADRAVDVFFDGAVN
jgi:AcrR family transcriptional regulator